MKRIKKRNIAAAFFVLLTLGCLPVYAEETDGSEEDPVLLTQQNSVLEKIEWDETKPYTVTTEEQYLRLAQYVVKTPADASQKLVYSSSDPDIVELDGTNATGKIVGTGNVLITVTVEDNPSLTISHEFEIIDSSDPVTIERVTPEDISVYAGYMYLDPQFEICYTPETAKQKTNWTSSNKKVLDPSSSMTSVTLPYTGMNPGKATVTATSDVNPELSVSFNLTAVNGHPAQGTYELEVQISEATSSGGLDPASAVTNPASYKFVKGKKYAVRITASSDEMVPGAGIVENEINSCSLLEATLESGQAVTNDAGQIGFDLTFAVEATKAGTESFSIGNCYTLKAIVEEPQKPSWKQDEKGWWYDNGDGTYPKNEWKTIDGVRYYFKPDGYMATKWTQIDGKWYFFTDNGVMEKNQWEGGYWLNADGTMATSQLVDNGKYYVKKDGVMATGWTQIDGKWYFFNPYGIMKKSAWEGKYWLKEDGTMATSQWVDGGKYYVKADGSYAVGWTQIDGKWYSFKNDGSMKKNQWDGDYWLGEDGVMVTNAWVDGGKYYVGPDGKWDRSKVKPVPKKGWNKDNRGWWYDYGDGTYPKNKFETINNVQYYFDQDGYMVTGWRQIGGYWYSFKDDGPMKTSQWDGDYWLKEDGKMAVNEWVDGGKYYVGPDGKWVPESPKPKTGWNQDSRGWWYVLDNGSYVKAKLWTIDGETYYFADDGYMVTGWYQIGSDWYSFANNGAMKKNQWDGDYWLKADGRMAVNEWVDGGKYYVGPDGKWVKDSPVSKKGWNNDSKGWWYVLDNGTYVRNSWMTIDGLRYYFKDDGYMATGWTEIGSKWYFFNPDGTMKVLAWEGEYWLKGDGTMATSQWVDDGKYYVGPDGKWDPTAKK